MADTILSLAYVTKEFRVGKTRVTAVEDVSLDVITGECLAIVGESGCGKSTVANMILGLFPPTRGGDQLSGFGLARAPQGRAPSGHSAGAAKSAPVCRRLAPPGFGRAPSR